jgi:hypothetical protein
LWQLAGLIRAEQASEPDRAAPDLYDRLVSQEGSERGNKLWLAACQEIAHEEAVDAAERDLRMAVKGTLAELETAAQALHQLRSEDAWHPDYAEGQDGADLEVLLVQAGSLLRAAARLVPDPPPAPAAAAASEPAGGPVLDANGDAVRVPPGIVPDKVFRLFMSGRVPARCGHYIAASEARAGLTTCERCMMGEG